MTDVFTRAAVANASTVNADKRTVDVVWTTGAPVKRYSWEDGFYLEILEVTPQAIRLGRFEAMSLLDGHEQAMSARLGTVVPGSVKIAGGKGTATIRFSKNDKADSIFRDLVDGHPIQISVGYRIHNSQKTEGAGDQLPTLRATDWEPLELSVVAVPADPGAVSRKDESMPENNIPADVQHQRPANIIAERTRAKTIRELARSAGIPESDADIAVDSGESVESFRDRAFDVMIERQNRAPTFPMVETRDTGHGDNCETEARIEALTCRMSGEKPSERARQYMSWTLEQHARASLEAAGINTRHMGRDEVFSSGRSYYPPHTTSDFPSLLLGAGERMLMAQYEAAQSPIKQRLCRSTTMSDFRKSHKLKIGDIDTLEQVSEGGEIHATTRGEAAESYGLSTFARIFSLSRNAQINDDLGGLADWSRAAGRAAAETENQIIVNLLLSNAKVGETNKGLFHADHGNLASQAAALSIDGISAARKAMRKQKAFGGKLPAGVTPAFLVVGPEFETLAEQLLAQLAAAKTEDVNPFAGRLELLVEPRIEDYQWYVFANPNTAAVIEYAHLSSAPGPQIAQREGFGTLGTDFRVVLDFGAGVIDYRGAYKNAGLAPTPPD